ncbi:iron-sulfur cluster repair protein YtfE [Pseudomonas sp. F1_0610]|uniref:iron-sulfur cluster repair protein YtfE n=1 Tax=Pseudomonas sp. F1_0610 TaxID=3114284 RepID=UPI0039C12768
MPALLLDNSLGSIATQIPQATQIFHALNLDFCCAGHKSLRQAATEQGLDPEQIASQLANLQAEAYSASNDWNLASNEQLIEHILLRYHAVHRTQLPELIRLAERVEQVHKNREECPKHLSQLLTQMLDDLDKHMQKEEMILFPMINRGQGNKAGGPIQVMRFEHKQHGEVLEQLKMLTHGMQPPADACSTWKALYLGLNELKVDLMQHIHLENNLLFPKALGLEV